MHHQTSSLDEESQELVSLDMNQRKKPSLPNPCIVLGISLLFIVFVIIIAKIGGRNLNENGVTVNDLTAKMYMHRHHVKTCEEMEFGCCEIFSDCIIVDNVLHYKNTSLQPFRTPKKNAKGTNCPRLKNLIQGYNQHYSESFDPKCLNQTDSQECCSINIACDENVRLSGSSVTPQYLNDKDDQKNEMSLFRIKHNYGLKCPDIHTMISAYNSHYPEYKFLDYLVTIVIFLGVMWWIVYG